MIPEWLNHGNRWVKFFKKQGFKTKLFRFLKYTLKVKYFYSFKVKKITIEMS